MRGLYTVFKKNDPPDYVCGIVSGGVEIAMLIKFLFRFYAKSKTELGIIYFSRYTSKKVENNSNAPSIKYFSGKNGPKLNKTAIIVDDNSNTGKTLQNVSDYLSTFGYTLKAYVAEFDPYRVLYKQKNFVKPPDTISNPNLFSCSVNIVPISYDGNQCLPFKQLRKLWRSDVVLDYYKSLLPLINSKNLSYSPFQGITSVDVKACAVHNLIDFLNLYNSGVRWFGIHCLYDSILYREKILRTKNSFLINLYEKLFEYIYGDVGGCPLLEMDSIIDMMNYIHDNDLNVNVVFLIDLNNFEKTTNTIKEKILKKDFFNANIFFQIQNRYNRKLINIFRKKYPEFKNIIQVISLNDTNPRYVLKKINKDKDIKYVIFDSAQYGGTGQEGPIDVLQDLTVACEKQFFIAGGINAENVKIKINQLLARSTNFKIDIESGFEDKKNYVLDISSQSLLTLRKSNKKIMDFFEILNFEAQRIINCRRYNALTLNDVSEFKNKYLNAWRLAMKTAGYYSTNTFIEYFAKSLIKESNSLPLLNKEKVLSIIRNGLISYSNVPDNPHLLLDDKYLTSEYYRDKGSPWLIKRTEGFLRDTCRLKNLNRFIIWTKGENEVDTNISEQRYKANRSGLTSLVNKYMDQKDHFFVTSPNKERLITSQEKDKIVVIDDTLENLVKVNCLYKEKDVCLIWLTPLGKKRTDGIKPMSSLYQVLSFLKTLKIPFSIYCDMDGVLIHEKFRNEHQPKNLFFELMNNNLVNDNELYRPYSPLSGESFDYINNKLKHASQKVVLISGPSGSGKSTLIKEVLKILPSVKYIKRITTRVQRINEVNHSNYEFVNETYFKFLVEQQRLLEYGYFGPGYYGTKIDTLLSVLNRGKKAVFEADADTVLYMTSVFKKLKIDFVTVLIVPSDMKDVTSSMNYLKTRINKRDAYQSSKDENSGRLKKAEYILSLVNRFDKIVVNENSLLERAKKDLLQIIED